MPPRKLPPIEDVIEMYRSGLSSGEIAEACHVKPVTVVSALRQAGEPMRGPKEAARLAVKSGRITPPRYWEGKKQPPEMVEKRAAAIRGDKHYLWKGGRSCRPYRRALEKEACAQCGSSENLGIHHRDFDHYNNEESNLEVLCVGCHMSLHKQAYWDARREGVQHPVSNGPVGWRKAGDKNDGDNPRGGQSDHA